jgi:hypothetical protein
MLITSFTYGTYYIHDKYMLIQFATLLINVSETNEPFLCLIVIRE